MVCVTKMVEHQLLNSWHKQLISKVGSNDREKKRREQHMHLASKVSSAVHEASEA